MCDVHDVLHGEIGAAGEDEFILDTPRVRAFVREAREAIAQTSSAVEACARIEPSFTSLLADQAWLPAAYQADAPESGMGGGIGQWLLFRSHDRSLCLFSLVVPPGAMTPIHDHLAWGIIGLYRGNQDEEFYQPGNGTIAAGGGVRSSRATTTSSSRRPTTFTACGRRRRRPRSRSTCSPTTRAASSVTPSTRPPVRHGRSSPATSTRSAWQSRRRTARKERRRQTCPRKPPSASSTRDERLSLPRVQDPARPGARVEGPRHRHVLPHPLRGHPRGPLDTERFTNRIGNAAGGRRNGSAPTTRTPRRCSCAPSPRSSGSSSQYEDTGLAARPDARRPRRAASTCSAARSSTTPSAPRASRTLDPFVEAARRSR